jgi:hypothetical protein
MRAPSISVAHRSASGKIDDMARLVSQAWHSWKSAKAVAVLFVVAFTLGIGSATAIYTVVNTLLLKPVPYEHGERFISVLGASFVDPSGMSGLRIGRISRVFDRGPCQGVRSSALLQGPQIRT